MKTATVTARIQPEIKQQAEEVLEQLGIPVSVLIDSLYRQIIMTNSIPVQGIRNASSSGLTLNFCLLERLMMILLKSIFYVFYHVWWKG